MGKNKLHKFFLAALVSTSPLLQVPSKIHANDGPKPDVQSLGGVSTEQMQQDFEEYASTHSAQLEDEVQAIDDKTGKQYIFLSDIKHDPSSKSGWNGIKKDKAPEGNAITLVIDGKTTVFDKGIGAHAKSNVIYDIRNYKDTYSKLSTYIGINYKPNSQSNGATFEFYGSNSKDGKWEQIGKKYEVHPNKEAIYVNLDVKKYNYIRLVTNDLGKDFQDQTVYADLKLTKPEYTRNSVKFDGVKTVDEYDRIISNRSIEDNFNHYKMDVLKREFVNRITYDAIQNTYRKNPEGVRETIKWLFGEEKNLQLFIEAGDFYSGNGQNAFNALVALYTAHSKDMNNLTYKKMLLATAAAYSKDVYIFLFNYGGERIKTNPVEKYERFKKLYDDGRFIRKDEFEKYPMELVRAVMDAKLSDEEIFWLRNYIDKKYPYHQNKDNYYRYNGYGYANYRDPDWSRTDFYDESKKYYWNNKYDFLKYGIDYGHMNKYRIWMLMEQGAICWGLSGLGMVVNEVQGIPAIGTYQPKHEAYFLYKQNAEGKGIWTMSDNIFGWKNSYTRWGTGVHSEHRMLMSWGQKDYNRVDGGNNSTYLVLGQDALNNYDAYLKSMYYVLIANSYKNNNQHKEALKTSLTHYSKNLDALHGLYKAYKKEKVSEEEWVALAETVAKEYRFFPAPMVDLLKLIKDEMKSNKNLLYVDLLAHNSLKAATNATEKDTTQPEVSREVASSILESEFNYIAKFSFDGQDANKVILNEKYANEAIGMKISLDGGHTWEESQVASNRNNQYQLSNDQVRRVNTNHDILVKINDRAEVYRIDITSGKEITSAVYQNDDENVLMGATEGLEYTINDGVTWNDYEGGLNSNRIFDGNIVVKFRYKATGTNVAGPEKMYTFRFDKGPATSKYLSLRNVSIHEVSSEQNSGSQQRLAQNFIDGSTRTSWHTRYNHYDKKYFAVKFDKVRFINKIKYLPNEGQNGRLKSGKIFTSMNGNDWELVHEFYGLENTLTWKTIDFGKSVEAKYLKIQATETYGNNDADRKMYMSGNLINFYEDTTQEHVDTVSVKYSGNGSSVTAKLQLPKGYQAFGATEYVFTRNGSMTFFYRDLSNRILPYAVRVDWL